MATLYAARTNALGRLRKPRLGRVFDRDRLFDELDAHASLPGLWIAGPPGIGKTTLVATYLQARSVACVWLQLDAGDADPASFVHFLRAAVPRGAPRLLAPTADDLRDVAAFVRRSLRRFAESLEPPWALVLDNVQQLGREGAALHAGIAAALADLPDRARLIAISREPPPDAYVRVLASQQLALLDERQLQFDEEDTRRLLALHGRDWHAAELRHATDGWAAAMILLLATRSELGLDAALRGGGARARLFAFFAGEVVAGMSRADAAALTRIAFLPSATPAMAQAISGDARAGDLLAELARRSLFTDCRDSTPPAYTFHALFSGFLRARAADELSAPALRALRIDAARLLAAHGQADAAIAELVAAQAWDEAFELTVAHAGCFIAQGRSAMVRTWLLALPDGVRELAPVQYWLGCCELAVDPVQALRYLQCAHRRYTAVGAASDSFCAAAAAADAIFSIGTGLHAIEPWLPLLESQASAYLAQRDVETDLRVLPGLLAAFVHCRTAQPLTAALAERAEGLLDQPLGAGQRILLGTLAYYLLWTGQTARLDRMMVKLDRMCAASDTAPATLLRWYGVSVLVRTLLGRVDEALNHARQALSLVGREGMAPLRAKAHLLLVLAAIAARDAALARMHLVEAAAVLDAGNAIDATTYEFQHGMLMLLEGNWPQADVLMRAAVGSARTSGWPLREHIALLGCTLAATQIGALDDAEAALQSALKHRFHAVCRWHHWLAGLIEAHLAERRGDRPRALNALRRALAVGRDHGYDFGPMPFACGDMMPRLAALALDHGIDAAFVEHIVRRHGLPAPNGAGECWPWPIRIRLLGAFGIERDGVAAATPRKESRRPLELLKLLVPMQAQSGGPVPVERLCAALWPDAEGDAARNSFDNTLHRLRKLLGGERHLLLHAGSLSLNAATCWTDVVALSDCLSAIDSRCPNCDSAAMLALAEQALRLYRGALLTGEDELPDVLSARARIETRFTRTLNTAGGLLEADGRQTDAVRLYQRVLERQPLAEDVYRRLIACLVGLGRRAEALDAYRCCRQQLSVHLDRRPAAETEALVDAIRDL